MKKLIYVVIPVLLLMSISIAGDTKVSTGKITGTVIDKEPAGGGLGRYVQGKKELGLATRRLETSTIAGSLGESRLENLPPVEFFETEIAVRTRP